MPSDMKLYFKGFAAAVVVGALAGATPAMLITIPLSLGILLTGGETGGLSDLYLCLLPLILSMPITLLGAIIFGLPTFWILHAKGVETVQNYISLGFFSGSTVSLLILVTLGGETNPFLVVCGGVAGAVTGWKWGKFREGVTHSEQD